MSKPRFTLPPAERALLEGCRQGDRRAQKGLYDRYTDAMYTLCYRITQNPELAQDALQEGFLGVFRGLGRFREESTLGAWIKTIVVRTAYKKVKQQGFTETLSDKLPDTALDWGHHLEVEYLQQAIESLSPGYRSVFVLIEIEGYAHKEVAEMLGISVGTSKSQLFYAKRQLQKKLKAMGVGL